MNAKEEFISVFKNHINKDVKVLCASICCYVYKTRKTYDVTLKQKYNKKEFEEFLNALDFDYDEGYGSQELDGTVWFTDGSWAVRREYDGTEWWEINTVPVIPTKCK
jgi:hypothetical protein